MPTLPRIEHRAATALAALFAALALYGLWSAPGLADKWGVAPMAVPVLLAWSTAAAWALATAWRAPTRAGWAAFGVAVVAMRVGSALLYAGRVSQSDPHWYIVLAQHLLAGGGLYVDDHAMGARVWAEFPPVYPVLLAGWGAVAGFGAVSLLALSAVLDGAAAAVIARLATRLMPGPDGVRAGRAAAALYLIWPATLLDAPLAQKESMEMLLVLLLAHGWLGAERGGVWRAAASVGVPAGLLALTQPGVASFAALAGLALAPRLGMRRFAPVAAGGAAVAVAVMAPWWWRNWRLFHAFVPLTSISGLSLWIGENPGSSGNWMPYDPSLIGLHELDCSRAAAHLAVEWMKAHPLGVLRLNGAKFVRAAGVGQFAVTRLAAMRPAPAPAMMAALLPLTHGAQVLLNAGAAAALLSARRRPALTALIAASVAQMLLFGVWFEFSERHRALLTPLVLLAAALAAAQVRRRTAPSAAFSALRPAA